MEIKENKPTPFLKRIANVEQEIKRLEQKIQTILKAIRK